jgi:cobalamin biosynthesis protein CobT
VRVPITSLLRSAKEAAAEVEASGIECIGIGIKDASVRSIYSKSVVVNNLDDLAGTVLKQLSKVLLDGRIIT